MVLEGIVSVIADLAEVFPIILSPGRNVSAVLMPCHVLLIRETVYMAQFNHNQDDVIG